jgi:hypothetical protein
MLILEEVGDKGSRQFITINHGLLLLYRREKEGLAEIERIAP